MNTSWAYTIIPNLKSANQLVSTALPSINPSGYIDQTGSLHGKKQNKLTPLECFETGLFTARMGKPSYNANKALINGIYLLSECYILSKKLNLVSPYQQFKNQTIFKRRRRGDKREGENKLVILRIQSFQKEVDSS